jgi:hypothetical protein
MKLLTRAAVVVFCFLLVLNAALGWAQEKYTKDQKLGSRKKASTVKPAERKSLNLESAAANASVNVKFYYQRTGTQNPSIASPKPLNWFHYFNQVCGDIDATYQGTSGGNYACVPAMLYWSPTMTYSKTAIWVYDPAQGTNTPHTSDGVITTGIDCFSDTIIHENVHVDQIRQADLLVPHEAKGWSWNYTPNNHYDASHNDLDTNDNDVPDSWEPYGIEDAAYGAENTAEDQYKTQDWANPGKQY